MRPLFFVGQICTDPFRHDYQERGVGHIHSIRAANELMGSVSYEWTIGIDG